MRQIILDTETTGLNPQEGHRVIEIACLEMVNRRLTGKHFHHYLNPERPIEKGAQAVHGITAEFLADKPKFKEIADEFLTMIKDAELIIHNAPFDLAFLDSELALLKTETQCQYDRIQENCTIIDTLLLARQLHPGQRNSLDALCQRYNIDNAHRNLHGALKDTELLAKVYLKMTGGQGQLFIDESFPTSGTKPTPPKDLVNPVNRAPIKVITASNDELTAHEVYLKHLAEENGKCLWSTE